MAGILYGKKLRKYCGIWARPTHEELHIITYGCMLYPGDAKTNPYQCSSLITAGVHGLLKHQNEKVEESKPKVKLARSRAAGEQESISVDLAAGEQELISVDQDPVLWHPAT